MDVKYVIVKNWHKSEFVGDILPFIADADVLSLENSRQPEERLQATESWVANLIHEDQEGLEGEIERERERVANLESKDPRLYDAAINLAIFEGQKPVIFTERHPNEDLVTMKGLKTDVSRLREQAADALIDGDYDGAMAKYTEALTKFCEAETMRDKSIARNIGEGTCVEKLLELYPEFKERESITYVTIIGAGHVPERYLEGVDFEVQTPSQKNPSRYNWYSEAVSKIRDSEDPTDDIARTLLTDELLMILPEVRETKLYARKAVENLSSNDLKDLATWYTRNDTGTLEDFFREKGIEVPETKDRMKELCQDFI